MAIHCNGAVHMPLVLQKTHVYTKRLLKTAKNEQCNTEWMGGKLKHATPDKS